MKYIVAEQELPIPDGVKVDIKARVVTVTGPLGKITKSFRHVPFELRKDKLKKNEKEGIKLRMWLQKKKRNATLGTIRSRIRNMITGVTVGYKFRMVLAYSHFPIVVNVIEGGKVFNHLCRPSKSKTFWVLK